MTRYLLIFGLLLITAPIARAAADEPTADRIILRDGSVVPGMVISPPVSRGPVEFLVRRAWAERNARGHLADWDRAASAATRQAIEQRQARLASWRREREPSAGVGPDDRIVRWIDGEQRRLADPDRAARAPLVIVRLPRSEVRDLDRRPAAAVRSLRLAWVGGVRDPESMKPEELADALEARGFSVDPKSQAPPAPLDRLLPPMPESDAIWQGRRAATEIATDTGLRFLRYQDMLMPDMGPGQPIADLNPATALSELKRMLDQDAQAQARPDPTVEKLQAIAARGRIGAAVMRLDIAPDLDGVSIETTFWVRVPAGRWVAYGSRTTSIRTDDLAPDEGRDLAEDPQVKGAFKMVEALGLGPIPAEFKQRGLRIGAATQKALGTARDAFNRDLEAQMLPVLERGADDAGEANKPAPVAERGGPGAAPAPRRSMLGPQNP